MLARCWLLAVLSTIGLLYACNKPQSVAEPVPEAAEDQDHQEKNKGKHKPVLKTSKKKRVIPDNQTEAAAAPATPSATSNDGSQSQGADQDRRRRDSDTGALGNPPVPAAASSGSCYKGEAEICAAEDEILRLVNQLRQDNGLPAYQGSARISFVAREWSKQQAKSGSISHNGFPGQRQSQLNSEFPGGQTRVRAENVAMTGGSIGSNGIAKQMFEMWANSPGHRANMLGRYGAMGVGLAQGGRGWYGTQIFGETDEP